MSFTKIKQPSKAPLLTLLVLNSQNSHLVSAAELPSAWGDFGILLVLNAQVKELLHWWLRWLSDRKGNKF